MSIEMEKLIVANNQRIDIYIDNLNLAIECHGIQHYKPNFFVKNQEQWSDMINKDKTKKDLLDRHGITLIEIPYNHKMKNSNDLKEFIFSHNFSTNTYDESLFKDSYEEYKKAQNKSYQKQKYEEYKHSYKEINKQKAKDRYNKLKEWKKKHETK